MSGQLTGAGRDQEKPDVAGRRPAVFAMSCCCTRHAGYPYLWPSRALRPPQSVEQGTPRGLMTLSPSHICPIRKKGISGVQPQKNVTLVAIEGLASNDSISGCGARILRGARPVVAGRGDNAAGCVLWLPGSRTDRVTVDGDGERPRARCWQLSRPTETPARRQ